MGFGTLFIGFFLLLNVMDSSFTDLISALVMALAFYKLSFINRDFKYAYRACYAMILVGVAELFVAIYSMFRNASLTLFTSLLSLARYTVVAIVVLYMLLGIKKLSKEVDLPQLEKKAERTLPFMLFSYCLLAILTRPELEGVIEPYYLALTSFIALLLNFILTIITLTIIYSAYMRICMPEDNNEIVEEKKSRFGFVNKFNEHTKEKSEEYARYKLEKMQKKNGKNKK